MSFIVTSTDPVELDSEDINSIDEVLIYPTARAAGARAETLAQADGRDRYVCKIEAVGYYRGRKFLDLRAEVK